MVHQITCQYTPSIWDTPSLAVIATYAADFMLASTVALGLDQGSPDTLAKKGLRPQYGRMLYRGMSRRLVQS